MRQDTFLIFTAYEEFEGLDTAEPEKNLMRAILQTAMDDIRKRGEPYREARRYLMSNDRFYVYSFLNVCQHLDLCPRKIRKLLGLHERRPMKFEGTVSARPQ